MRRVVPAANLGDSGALLASDSSSSNASKSGQPDLGNKATTRNVARVVRVISAEIRNALQTPQLLSPHHAFSVPYARIRKPLSLHVEINLYLYNRDSAHAGSGRKSGMCGLSFFTVGKEKNHGGQLTPLFLGRHRGLLSVSI